MSNTFDSQEQYFDENEPEFDIREINRRIDSENFNNCKSMVIQSSPRRNLTIKVNLKTQKSNSLMNSKSTSPTKDRPKTFQNRNDIFFQSSPIKATGQTPANKNNNKSCYSGTNFRTIYAHKKSLINIESIINDSPVKPERKSISPNRKSLYWQSWLIEGRDSKNQIKNQLDFFSTLIKLDREPNPSRITARSYCAIVSENNEVFLEYQSHERRQIASLTKIMTAFTVVNLCNSYGIKIKQHPITIHQQASFMEGTSANLRIDQEFFVIDLLYGLLLPSGNDAGVALAQYFGKFLSFKFAHDDQSLSQMYSTSIQRFNSMKDYYDIQYAKDSIKLFVFEMNKNCQKIGLKNTHFANPTGLSNSKNYSTAKDIATLTSYCLKNYTLRQIFRKKSYTCITKNLKLSYTRQVQWKNTNRHLFQFKECIGAKTGLTQTAGPCLSSVYKVLNKQIIVVVLGCASVQDRYEDARQIYKWCRRNMKIR